MITLPDEIRPCLEGVFPSRVVTCSSAGLPNATVLSQIYYVDPSHVALSHQFFNKTKRNVTENPYACAWCIHPMTFECWVLDLRFDHAETEGAVFDEMDMKIEAIASMTGMSGVFKLRAADIYEVLEFTRIQPLT